MLCDFVLNCDSIVYFVYVYNLVVVFGVDDYIGIWIWVCVFGNIVVVCGSDFNFLVGLYGGCDCGDDFIFCCWVYYYCCLDISIINVLILL